MNLDNEILTIGEDLYETMKHNGTFHFAKITEFVPQILLLAETFPKLSVDDKKRFIVDSLSLALQLSKRDLLLETNDTKLLSETELKEIFREKDKTIELIQTCVPIMVNTAMMAINGYFIIKETKQKCTDWWSSICSTKTCCQSENAKVKYRLDTTYFRKIPEIKHRFAVIKQRWKRTQARKLCE